MKRIVLIIVIIASVFTIYSQLNDPVLAVTSTAEQLIYDQEKGIIRDGDEIYLTLFRSITVNEILTYTLVCVHSSNNGSDFSETMIEEFEIPVNDGSLLLERKYAPVITRADNDNILIFFTNPETTHPQTAVSSDNGETFVMSDITGLAGRSQYQIVKYAENIELVAIEENVSFPTSDFEFLTMYEYSENDEYTCTDKPKFWGPDIIWGPVHSNTDIWLQQAGGGTNNNWPTFHGVVTTSGRIMNSATGQPAELTAPMDDIFLGGYFENVSQLTLPSIAENVRENGVILEESSEHDILFAQIEGNIAHLRYADWAYETEEFTVYNSFPDAAHPNTPIGDSIWTNEINVKELVWSEETEDMEVIDTSIFVNCQLWIEGSIGSNMTWASADTVFITSDIHYDDIAMGDPAENSVYIFGLISEERISIKYKYRDHLGEIHDDNCDDIYMYGCYAAIGDGDFDLYGNMNSHYEGVITLEYKHPHGSTPSFTHIMPGGEEWLVMYPDFQKYIFPPTPMWTGDPGFLLHCGNPVTGNNGFDTCGYPYENSGYSNPAVTPYGTDYPWYNPIWPEGSNARMGERGTIYVYGGLHQRRRGWVHLSGSDPLSHNDNEWDIEHWNYGGTHGPAGYAKDYHYDDRLLETSPIDYLKVSLENMSYNTFVNSSEISLYDYFSETGEVTVIATYTLPSNNFQLVDTCVDDEQYTFMLVENPAGQPQNYLLKYNDNEWELIEFDDNLINLVSIDPMNEFYVLKAGNELHLVNGEGIIQPGWIFTSYSILSDFTNTQGNNLHYISEQNFIYYYRVSEIMSQGMCNLLGEFEFSLDELAELLNPNFSLLYNSDGKIVMQIMDRDTQATFTYKNIYLATGDISGFFTSTPEDEITIITQLNIYPNPFNPLANISFGLAEPGFVEIDIYNLKGQKVKSLAQEYYDRGNFQIVWDASLNSSGVYFIEMTIDHELTYWGKLTLLK